VTSLSYVSPFSDKGLIVSYIGAQPTTASFPFDQFSGNGSTTAFTLTYAPASTTSIIVAISGVVQNPNLYSVIGTTLTFSPAPPSGTNNISVLYLGLPVIGVSSPGNTAYRTAEDFTATASQTVFTPSGSYTVGFLDVYRNGARLGSADFTATNGTTVTLTNACTAGDLVTIIYFTLVSIANAIPQSGGTFTGGVSGTSFSVAAGTLYPLVSDTAKSATSTSVDFTGIPSWAKRITVMFNGVSTNGTSLIQIQIGDSGGIETTSYSSGAWTANTNNANSTAGFIIHAANASAARVWDGAYTIVLQDATNTWVSTGMCNSLNDNAQSIGIGRKQVSATLDRVRITTVNGTDTFDAGSINIMWE
jgi:hypothetical protein